MARRKKGELKQQPSMLERQLEKLSTLVENFIILDLAMRGFSYQTIRKAVGGDIHRITKFLKPINKEIKKLRR